MLLEMKCFTFSGNLTVKGKRKIKSVKLELIITQNGGKVVKDFSTKFPAKIVGTLVTVQHEIEKAGGKLNKGIIMAYQCKWSFVSPEFILQYKDADIAVPLVDNKDDFKLNLQPLDSLPKSSVVKLSISNLSHHFLEKQDVSSHRIIKKALRDKVPKKKSSAAVSITKKEVFGYPAFVRENYPKLKAETGLGKVSELTGLLSERWNLLSPEEKKPSSTKSAEKENQNEPEQYVPMSQN